MYIYQIEVSNICSLRCNYCPHRYQKRKKGFMSFEVFRKCVELYKKCENRNFLFLHNFGEVMLHPQLETFISYAKEQGVECSFFTNGVDLLGRPFSRDYWKKLKKAGLNQVDFSAHKLQEGEFREITKDIIRTNRVFDPKKDILWTWAGQTGEPQKPSMEKCIFEKKNAFVVLWDGTISSCCLDVEGQRSECHINDVLEKKTYAFEGINLCNSCASMREDENL